MRCLWWIKVCYGLYGNIMQFQVSPIRENRGGIADLHLLRTLLAIHQNSWEPIFSEVMDSFIVSMCKFRNFKNLFATITSLSELYLRFRRFVLLVQTTTKKDFYQLSAVQAAEKHGDEWGSTWCLKWGIYISTPTWIHLQNSFAAAEALNLKISLHGTSLKWS